VSKPINPKQENPAMRSIWAVATNTIKQVLRMKIAAVFIILLMVLLPVMGTTTTGDGTLKGRLQTFVSYGLSLTSFLLCLLTIIISIHSLTSDIDQKQIYTVLTKPIRRFQLVLGKLLGVVLLDIILLVPFSAIIYSITIYTPKFIDTTEAQRIEADNEFFTARVDLAPVEVDVTREVLDTYKKLQESGQLEEMFQGMSRKEIIAQLTNQKKLQMRSAAAGRDLLWEFHNVKPTDPNGSLFIKFKYDVSGISSTDLPVYGRWLVGDWQYIRYGVVGETPVYDRVLSHSIRTFHEIEIDAAVVPKDGHLAVGFLNVPVNKTVVIFSEDPKALYKIDTFTANFIRAALLILLRLIFLACLGILAATFLSFPVAIMLSLAVFFIASFSGFFVESFDFLNKNLSTIYRYTIWPIILLMPKFDRFNPTQLLVEGRYLSWLLLAKISFSLICIKALLLLLLGLLIFSFKEIAKIII
jgi:hypothetical protein